MFIVALAILAIVAVIDQQLGLNADQQRYLMAVAGAVIAAGYVISWRLPK